MIASVGLVVNYFVSFKTSCLDYAFLVGLCLLLRRKILFQIAKQKCAFQVRSQEFAVGEGVLFWRLETTSKHLDPDFDWSSLRLIRFFCPNLGDLQKKGLH